MQRSLVQDTLPLTGSTDAGRRRVAYSAAAASIIAFAVMRLVVSPAQFDDLIVYRAEGDAIRHGLPLYGDLPGVHGAATYPPFAAIVFVVVAVVPLSAVKLLNFAASIAALCWVSLRSARLAGADRRRSWLLAAVGVAAGLWCEPVYTTFTYGQINLYLLALVLWDFTLADGSRFRGVGTGLAAALKVTPLVFVGYLVLTRRFAHAARAVAVFVVALAISLLVDRKSTIDYWTHYVFQFNRVGRLENAVNQTVRGWLVRMHHTREPQPLEWILGVAVGVAGLTIAVLAYRRLGNRWGLLVSAITGLLVSPISWSHHWVWCVPVLLLLWVEGYRWLCGFGAVVFLSFVVWWQPHADSAELHYSWWQILLSGWYVVFGLAFLVLTAVACRRAGQSSSDGNGWSWTIRRRETARVKTT